MHTKRTFEAFIKDLCSEFDFPFGDSNLWIFHFVAPYLSKYDDEYILWYDSETVEGPRGKIRLSREDCGRPISKIRLRAHFDNCESIVSDLIHPDAFEVSLRVIDCPTCIETEVRCKAFIRKLFYRFAQYRDRMYAARKIQRAWRRCRDNPEYKMCTRVRMRDVEDDNDGVFVRE